MDTSVSFEHGGFRVIVWAYTMLMPLLYYKLYDIINATIKETERPF